jgi:glycosyltransferase involved in cell wall biosynthesis
MAVLGDLPRLRWTIRDLGLEDRVTLNGEASPDEVAAKLGSADVFLHPSLSEGLPNVILEGMASGLPIVATDVGGTGEAVRDDVEGLLVPPRDAHAIAAALARLWRDPVLAARLGGAGRARVAAFTLERQTELWDAFYREAVA